MSHADLSYGNAAPKIVNVVIEIQKGSRNKYEIDKSTGIMMLDRVNQTFLAQPTDYGYVPNTLGEDGDPLDAMLIIDESVPVGTCVPARVIGVMYMVDSGENDEKLIVVPADDQSQDHIVTLEDLGEHFKKAVTHYFEHYKDLKGKKVEIKGWGDADAAYTLIGQCIERASA
jgi:inorganic pyrophosphatase